LSPLGSRLEIVVIANAGDLPPPVRKLPSVQTPCRWGVDLQSDAPADGPIDRALPGWVITAGPCPQAVHVATSARFGDTCEEFHDDISDFVSRDALEGLHRVEELLTNDVLGKAPSRLLTYGDAARPGGLDKIAESALTVGERWRRDRLGRRGPP
jgi:hypothetical protein